MGKIPQKPESIKKVKKNLGANDSSLNKGSTSIDRPKRPSIPSEVKLRLWIEAGGRCEFPGCNKYLYHDQITLAPGNFSNIAHIVSWIETGPRGDEIESPMLATNISNLMLMCKDHAGDIDLKENEEKYNKFVLRNYKKQHEERILTQTSIHEETYKTKILVFNINVGDRLIPISTEGLFYAIAPRFSIKLSPDVLSISTFNRNAGQEYWQGYTSQIKDFVDTVKGKFSNGSIEKHISIFAIGPMPLLMYLGKCIGDVPGHDVFQLFRDITDEKKRWAWPVGSQFIEPYEIIYPSKTSDTKKVALILEVSDRIHNNQLQSTVDNSYDIFRITVPNPSVHFLKSKDQLINFSYEYRKVLDHIKHVYGPDCEIDLFPAVPVSIAVQCGLSLLPTKDPTIHVYEFYKDQQEFKRVLKLQ